MPYKKLNQLQKLLKNFEIKKSLCFIDECKLQSIGSHSISESRVLEHLQEKDGKHGLALLHLEDKPTVDFKLKKLSSYKNQERQLVRKGKSKASVFYGFCNKHDPDLFYQLDNETYKNNSKINFLHAYRAYALYVSNSNNQIYLFQNKVLESIKSINPEAAKINPALTEVSKLINQIPDDILIGFEEMKPLIEEIDETIRKNILIKESDLKESFNEQLSQFTDENSFPITGFLFKKNLQSIFDSSSEIEVSDELITNLEEAIKLRTKENDWLKSIINPACLNENYNELKYLSRPLNTVYGITGNFVFRGTNNDFLSLTFFPEYESGKTQVIISSLENNETFLSQLNIMDDIQYKTLLSSIIIGQGTNVFMKPSFFESIDAEVKAMILEKKVSFIQKSFNIF